MSESKPQTELVGDLAGIGRGVRANSRKGIIISASALTIFFLACIIALVLLPGADREKALGAILDGALLGGVYAMIALGVVVVFKASKVFNLAHGGVLMLMAYVLWWLLASAGLPLWLSLVLLALTSVVLGWAVDRFVMRRLIGQSGLTTFIVTLVLGFFVIQGLAVLLFKGTPEVMPSIFPTGYLVIGNLSFYYARVYSFVVAILMFLLFVLYFRYTRSGLIMRSVSESHTVSQSLGIDVKRIFAVSWIIACLSAAVGGLLLGSMFAVDGTMGSFALIRALPVLLLGGLESVPGVLIGALIVGIGETVAGTYIDPYVTGFRELVPYILIVAILILRPHGLFGLREIRRI